VREVLFPCFRISASGLLFRFRSLWWWDSRCPFGCFLLSLFWTRCRSHTSLSFSETQHNNTGAGTTSKREYY